LRGHLQTATSGLRASLHFAFYPTPRCAYAAHLRRRFRLRVPCFKRHQLAYALLDALRTDAGQNLLNLGVGGGGAEGAGRLGAGR